MNINIPTAEIGQCDKFMKNDGVFTNETVIITPLRLTMLSPESCKISFGCNLWRSCFNEDCSYCHAGMNKNKTNPWDTSGSNSVRLSND
jgi:hypothetical protein